MPMGEGADCQAVLPDTYNMLGYMNDSYCNCSDRLWQTSNHTIFPHTVGRERGSGQGRPLPENFIEPTWSLLTHCSAYCHLPSPVFYVNKFVIFFEFLSVFLANLQVSLTTFHHVEKILLFLWSLCQSCKVS